MEERVRRSVGLVLDYGGGETRGRNGCSNSGSIERKVRCAPKARDYRPGLPERGFQRVDGWRDRTAQKNNIRKKRSVP